VAGARRDRRRGEALTVRLLQICPRLPWPLTDGGVVGVYQITRILAGLGHEVTLVTNRPARADDPGELARWARVVTVPLPGRWGATAGRSLAGGQPLAFARFANPALRAAALDLAARERFDAVHVDHAHLGAVGLALRGATGLPFALREHNVETTIYERFAGVQPDPLRRALARLEAGRVRRAEARALAGAQRVFAITPEDRERILRLAPQARVVTIPACVDTDRLAPLEDPEDGPRVVWLGGLDWRPNADAVAWFVDRVWPGVRARAAGAEFHLVGRGTREFAARRRAPGVVGRGLVDDPRAAIAASNLAVVPLRVGGGMRLKILELMALQRATVATTVGAEGIRACPGEEIVLADEPGAFADAVTRLLEDRAERRRIARAARRRAEETYACGRVAEAYAAAYAALLAER
jgi:glycosyltransferase involved in cell wall biosynthesis